MDDIRILGGLIGISLLSFSFWRLLGKNFGKIQQGVRRFFLWTFLLSFAFPYFRFTPRIKELILEKVDLNYLLGELIGEFKGTDWADGILTTTFFFLYLGIIFWAWSKEKKESKKKDDKPPEEKPFKIEARIGNIKDEKKDEKAG